MELSEAGFKICSNKYQSLWFPSNLIMNPIYSISATNIKTQQKLMRKRIWKKPISSTTLFSTNWSCLTTITWPAGAKCSPKPSPQSINATTWLIWCQPPVPAMKWYTCSAGTATSMSSKSLEIGTYSWPKTFTCSMTSWNSTFSLIIITIVRLLLKTRQVSKVKSNHKNLKN